MAPHWNLGRRRLQLPVPDWDLFGGGNAAAFATLIFDSVSHCFAACEQAKRRGALCNLNLCRYHPSVPMKHGDRNPGPTHTVPREDFNEKT